MAKRQPNEAEAECTHCKAITHRPYFANEPVGTLLLGYPGGGQYGRCYLCKKSGLKIIRTRETKPKGPEGWRVS